MWLHLISLVCLTTLVECNKWIPGKVTPFLNQSSQGVYRFRGGKNDGKSFYSYWYQDDVAKKLALGIGEIGNATFQAAFWFFRDVAYEVNPSKKEGAIDGVECKKFVDFNYSMEIGGYDPRYLSSMGVFTMHETNETTKVELFAGQALDGVGPLNVVCVLDTTDGTYAKMYTVQAIGHAHYSEYYLFPRNDSRPAEWGGDHVFDLHESCLKPDIKVVRFFDTFNMKGERIDQKKENKTECPDKGDGDKGDGDKGDGDKGDGDKGDGKKGDNHGSGSIGFASSMWCLIIATFAVYSSLV